MRTRCSEPGDVVELSSIEAYRDHVQHRWVLCKPSKTAKIEHDGIEFTADGRWYFLKIEPDGDALQRLKGFDASGRWSFYASAVNGKLTPQLNIFLNGGAYAARVTFQERPSAMRLDGFGTSVDYVSAD